MFRIPPRVVLSSLLALGAFAPPRASAQEKPATAPVTRNVAIVIFPGVELLDFAGPAEVFAGARGKNGDSFHVYTVAESAGPVDSLGVVTITPQYTLATCPKPDIVVVPGGAVPDESEPLRVWLQARAKDTDLMMSVCNGAVVYAKAGLLRGLEVTTHHSALQSVAMFEPEAKVFTNRRFVDNGRVLTSAGIAAGIDGALHVVERYLGSESAWNSARYMEYDWRPDEIAKLHAQPGTRVEGADGQKWVASIRRLGQAGALAEFRKLEKPPTESQLNAWGYWMLGSSKVDDAVELLRLAAAAFPLSANAMDSLSDALEAKGDAEGAKQAARECLAKLEKETDRPAENRDMLRNSADSRIARLSGAPPSQLRFTCPPCGGGSKCDKIAFVRSGKCTSCGMQLVERSQQ